MDRTNAISDGHSELKRLNDSRYKLNIRTKRWRRTRRLNQWML